MTRDPCEHLQKKWLPLPKTEEDPEERRALEAQHGRAWNTEELERDFIVERVAPPLVIVVRRCDGMRGSLWFHPSASYRLFYGFTATFS